MGYLVGNTGNIGDCFIEWLSQQPNWSEIVDPLETFVEQTIERCVGPDAHVVGPMNQTLYRSSSKDGSSNGIGIPQRWSI